MILISIQLIIKSNISSSLLYLALCVSFIYCHIYQGCNWIFLEYGTFYWDIFKYNFDTNITLNHGKDVELLFFFKQKLMSIITICFWSILIYVVIKIEILFNILNDRQFSHYHFNWNSILFSTKIAFFKRIDHWNYKKSKFFVVLIM